MGSSRPLNVQLTSSDHDFSDAVSRQDIGSVHRLDEDKINCVMQLIADVLPIVGTEILQKLLP
jgi:hypothetical protein